MNTPIETRQAQLQRLWERGIDSLEHELTIAEARGAAGALDAKYLTIKEAAGLLRCCRESIYNYIKAGKLSFVRSVSGRRLVRRDDLIDFQHSVQGQS